MVDHSKFHLQEISKLSSLNVRLSFQLELERKFKPQFLFPFNNSVSNQVLLNNCRVKHKWRKPKAKK